MSEEAMSDHARQTPNRSPSVAAPARDQGWQPIASAPKDGTRVLVYDGVEMLVAQYLPGYGYRMGILSNRKPTHWHALPTPPAQGGTEG